MTTNINDGLEWTDVSEGVKRPVATREMGVSERKYGNFYLTIFRRVRPVGRDNINEKANILFAIE